MNLFISSTIYDLIDVRSEVFHFLRDLGCEVRMSEQIESHFEYIRGLTSIAMCLENVRRSDFTIVILDQRYGSTLEKYGYDISATHLEYKTAMEANVPVLMFSRDRTWSEYSIYKNLPEEDKLKFNGSWVDAKNRKIFKILEEHSRPPEEPGVSNWLYLFSTSFDLKSGIHKALRIPYLKESIPKRIAEGTLPLLSVTQEHRPEGDRALRINVFVTNNSKSAAFIDRMTWDETLFQWPQILQPGAEFEITYVWNHSGFHRETERILNLVYRSFDGIKMREEFRLTIRTMPDQTIHSHVFCDTRDFTIADPVVIPIAQSS